MSLKDSIESKTTKTMSFTDYSFVYDGGIPDGFTLRDELDVVEEHPGQLLIIFAPTREGEKPEYMTIQTSKIITQRIKQWTREVEITPTPRRPRQDSDPTPEVLDPEEPEASPSQPDDPGSSATSGTSRRRRVSRPQPAVTSPELPAPRRPQSRRKKSAPASRPQATTDAHTSESSTDDAQKD